jgi:N-acetylneuraminic acid mutarotase
MKRNNIALCSLMLLGVLFSCSKASLNYTQNGNWVSRATFAGIPMGFGASFVVGNSAYVGTGYNPANPNVRLNAMYQYQASSIPPTPTGYDSAYGGWTQVTSFPGAGRSNAVGFSIGNYGYLGAGTVDGYTPLSDFYQYNPSNNTWAQIDSLGVPGARAPRFDAVAFGFDTTGYVLTGTDNNYYFGDVWQYSPTANSWTLQTNMPGSPRSRAITWVYNGKGYLLTGYTTTGQWVASGGNACYDFWRFDPTLASNQAWTRLRDISNTNPGTFDDGYTNIIRYWGVGFTILGTSTGDKGYVSTGANGSANAYTWEYDFATDLWIEKTPYEGGARTGAVGFSLPLPGVQGETTRGFLATGLSGAQAGQGDCREFFPNQIYNQFD